MENTKKQLSLFWRKLGKMLSSGVPLAKSLEVLKEEITGQELNRKVGNIILDINAGCALSESLKKYPALFPPSLHAMVVSGEMRGNLDKVAKEIADGIEEGTFAIEGSAVDTNHDSVAVEESDMKKLQAHQEHINCLIHEASDTGASDVHLEWVASQLRARFRIDGVLKEIEHNIPRDQQNAVISRIKALASMDVAEKNLPQDGRMFIESEGKGIDIRACCIPYVTGESIVMRLLEQNVVLPSLEWEDFAFGDEKLRQIRRWIHRPHGIVIINGVTGSGKTTTLYSILRELNTPQVKITTIEDPVEYQFDGMNQLQINPRAGLTFTAAARAQLRQDPDIIMVSEIRDPEMLQVVMQMAMTGHLVLTSLHAQDNAQALRRLLDVGAEPFQINNTLVGLLSQRLVRKTCDNCREQYKPEKPFADIVKKHKDFIFYRGKGCDKCQGSGYRGRIAVHEMLELDDDLRRLISADAGVDALKNQAIKSGMITLTEDGLLKAAQGITTIEEVIRVCGMS